MDAERALIAAQAANDWHAEAAALRRLYPSKRRQWKRVPDHIRFFDKLAFGASGCWIWTGALDGGGYGLVNSRCDSRAHRWAWRLFNGAIPAGVKVLHRCDVRCCVNPEHLFLGTQADNVADMVSKGRARYHTGHFGEAHPLSKLTWPKVREIRCLARDGMAQAEIARRFGMSPMAISRIVRNISWRES